MPVIGFVVKIPFGIHLLSISLYTPIITVNNQLNQFLVFIVNGSSGVWWGKYRNKFYWFYIGG
jgi:hypothetical protein